MCKNKRKGVKMEDEKKILISLEEMSRVLSIEPKTLVRKIYRDKNIPHYKISGDLRFDYKETLNYFKKA